MINTMKNYPNVFSGSIFTGIVLLVVIGCVSCGGGGGGSSSGSSGGGSGFNCPSVSDNATWDSYGRFVFNSMGRDSTARSIISECGWHVHNNHNGGTGDTLQVASPDEGVVFVWAYNSFYAYRLTQGWKGATKEGLKMGSDMNVFFGLYPNAYQTGNLTYRIPNDSMAIYVMFNDTGFVEKILVGYYYRN